MPDFDKLRLEMVNSQLISRGISDKKTLDAFRRVPRHAFVPAELRADAYDDCALPIGEGQTISQPYMVALMTELLGLKGNEKVLEIGTGSGYQAAILAELCRKVYSVERMTALSERAGNTLAELGYANIELIAGDGTEGWAKSAPYDGIVVTAAGAEIPAPLLEQLAEGGRLVAPVGERFYQQLIIVEKKNGKLNRRESIGCVFVPLVGKYSRGF